MFFSGTATFHLTIRILHPSKHKKDISPTEDQPHHTDGFARLRASHGRTNSPPDCLFGPAFRILCPPPPNKKPDLSVWFVWWGRTDSNHRSDTQQIYSLSPLATRELPHMKFSVCLVGAGRRTRTPDLLITNQLLYRLSYTGGSHRTSLL